MLSRRRRLGRVPRPPFRFRTSPWGSPVHEDQLWVEKSLEGDEAAFGFLLRKYQRRVYSLVYRMVYHREDAEDLTQETFVKAHSYLRSYNPSYPFDRWLLRIATNLSIDFLRRRRLKTVPLDPLQAPGWEPRDAGASPLELVEEGETEGRLQSALAQVAEEYRMALLLRHQEGLRYDEIAKVLDVPLGTVKARIHRGRAQLARLLFGEEEEGLRWGGVSP